MSQKQGIETRDVFACRLQYLRAQGMMRDMRSAWITVATLVALTAIALLLLPLPDSCDEPGSLVLCTYRSSAAGLMFARNSPLPVVEAVAALVLVALVGAALVVRGRRQSNRRTVR